MPTVRDCMALSDIDPDLDEAATTWYLNHMQDKEKQNGLIYDSELWTGEDRRTALWWMYLSTNEDSTVSYQFKVNDVERYIDIDLRSLGDTATTLSIKPEIDISFQSGSETIHGLVKPLNGKALVEIELTANVRKKFDPESKEYRKLSNKIAVQELVYSLVLNNEPDDKPEKYRYELIMNMPIEENFRSLVATVIDAKRKLTHGIATTYIDGSYLLVADIELEEGKGGQPIMFPFSSSFFIPTL